MPRDSYHRRLLVCLCLSALAAAAAQALTLTGNIDATDPQMPVVFISTPNCTGQGATPVLYEALPIFVTESGTYDFSMTSPEGFASLYLMSADFDPANGFPSCIAADNSGNPVTFAANLVAGTDYFAVPFDDTFAQAGGDYALDITGPGEVLEGAFTIQAIPTLSQWGLLILAALVASVGLIGIRKLRRA